LTSLLSALLFAVPAEFALPVGAPPIVAPVANVRDFGAIGDGLADDTAALQSAIDSLTDGGTVLLPPGTYVYTKVLQIKRPRVRVWGYGATLHAPDPQQQSVQLNAPDTMLCGLRLTAEVETRQSKPQHHRIVLGSQRVVVVDNHVDGGSAAGLFAYRADGYLIARNTVENTLADAIHSTGGSHHGLIVGNRVRHPGDDMIAVVTYGTGNPCHDILILDNDVANQDWGRGITVVGGERITIRGNRIDRPNHGAGILINREGSYKTDGCRDIVVEHNVITQVQTTGTPKQNKRTGQGAIDLNSGGHEGEDGLFVERVMVRHNTIAGVARHGLFVRGWTRGAVFQNNQLYAVGGQPLQIEARSTEPDKVIAVGNTYQGEPVAFGGPTGPWPEITGADEAAVVAMIGPLW